jgi:hypothetical protein
LKFQGSLNLGHACGCKDNCQEMNYDKSIEYGFDLSHPSKQPSSKIFQKMLRLRHSGKRFTKRWVFFKRAGGNCPSYFREIDILQLFSRLYIIL